MTIRIYSRENAELLQDEVQLFSKIHLLLINHVMEQPATWNQFLQLIGCTQFLNQFIFARCKNENMLETSQNRVSSYEILCGVIQQMCARYF